MLSIKFSKLIEIQESKPYKTLETEQGYELSFSIDYSDI
jgi:hypothetical protein